MSAVDRLGRMEGTEHRAGGSRDPILKIDGVAKAFGDLQAVRDVSLELRSGEILALVGPNGAGKTTLLRMIIGMLSPDQGRIRYGVDGQLVDRLDPTRLGYLPEERGLYLDVPTRRMLLYFAALRGMSRPSAKVESDRWLERLELLDRAGDEVRSLSKGNQQKVQFLTAILHRPALAVLDEPFSGLDPLNQELFLDLVRELVDDGTTVLFSAHQMQLVERLADRIILMGRGRFVAQGTLAELEAEWGRASLHDIYVRAVGQVGVEA